MPDSHLNNKIAEALQSTGGNKHDAQKLLITWAVRDPILLLAMAKPHLKAIAAALIDHAVRSKTAPVSTDNGPDNFSKSAIDDMISSASGRRMSDKRTTRIPPPKSTERQASTMRKLAAAFTKKDK